MATFQTFQEVGIKEDISDVISNISPTKVPFQSAIGREKVTQPLFQWQEDSLRAVATNAAVEGADVSYITVNPTVMRSNITQIFTEAVVVSDTVQATSAYGRAKELAYQLAKSSMQVKRDLENALVGTAQAQVAGNSSTARQFTGVARQIAAGSITYTGAGPAPLSETALLNNLQACYTAGADPSQVHVTPGDSLIVAAFAAASGRYRTFNQGTEGAKTITNVVNLYVSPFGEQKISINRFQKSGETIVFEPGMWSLPVLRNWTRETLAKTGDATKQMIVGEFSVKHKNQSASGLIVQGTTGY
jgi:hypothetical protein